MTNLPRRYAAAFRFGCTQPDKNPTTYLKGSLRNQMLRGHNWESSERYMQRICARLQRRKKLRLLDYYTLGKLIHYTADAFTHTHNGAFTDDLKTHRRYEHHLQKQFLACLTQPPTHRLGLGGSIMDAIRCCHRQYQNTAANTAADCRYSILAVSQIMQMLLSKPAAISC